MIPTFTFPTPPPEPANRSFPSWRDWVLGYAENVGNYVVGYQAEWARQFNTLLNGYGPDIVSATSITAANAVHRVTGTAAVQTIAQPMGQTAVGVLTLLAKDGFSLMSGGNISAPSTIQVPAGSAVMLAYDPTLKTWITQASQGHTFSVINLVATSTDSPYAVPSGAVFVGVSLDTGVFTANLSANPTVGDTVTFKVLTNPGGLQQLTIHPAPGMTIDGNTTDYALKPVTAARSLLYAAANQWLFYGSY